MGIEGLTEVRLFDIAEKCDGKSSEAQRKYRFENEKLKFGYFYFDTFDSRKKFDNSCRERQYIFNNLEFMSRSGEKLFEHPFIGSGRKNMDTGNNNRKQQNRSQNNRKQGNRSQNNKLKKTAKSNDWQ